MSMFQTKLHKEFKAPSEKVYHFICHPQSDAEEMLSVLLMWGREVEKHILESKKKQKKEKCCEPFEECPEQYKEEIKNASSKSSGKIQKIDA